MIVRFLRKTFACFAKNLKLIVVIGYTILDKILMKNTAFTKFHQEAGARMVPFAGYNMPVEYSGITEEHITVRERVGVFDVSHMGEFWVTGKSSQEFLQYITSNDVSSLFDGKIQYSCFPNGKADKQQIK